MQREREGERNLLKAISNISKEIKINFYIIKTAVQAGEKEGKKRKFLFYSSWIDLVIREKTLLFLPQPLLIYRLPFRSYSSAENFFFFKITQKFIMNLLEFHDNFFSLPFLPFTDSQQNLLACGFTKVFGFITD